MSLSDKLDRLENLLGEALSPDKIWARSSEEIADIFYRHFFRPPGGLFDVLHETKSRVREEYVKVAEAELKPKLGKSAWKYDKTAARGLEAKLRGLGWDYDASGKFLGNYSLFTNGRTPPYVRVGLTTKAGEQDMMAIDANDVVYVNEHDAYFGKGLSLLYLKLRPIVLQHGTKKLSLVVLEELQSTAHGLENADVSDAVNIALDQANTLLGSTPIFLAVNDKAPRQQRESVYAQLIGARGLERIGHLGKRIAEELSELVGAYVNDEYNVFYAPPGLDLKQILPEDMRVKPDPEKIRSHVFFDAKTHAPILSGRIGEEFGIEDAHTYDEKVYFSLRIPPSGADKIRDVLNSMRERYLPEYNVSSTELFNGKITVTVAVSAGRIAQEVINAYKEKFAAAQRNLATEDIKQHIVEDEESERADRAVEGKLKQVVIRAERGDAKVSASLLVQIKTDLELIRTSREQGDDPTKKMPEVYERLRGYLEKTGGVFRAARRELNATEYKDVLRKLHDLILDVDGEEARLPKDVYDKVEQVLEQAHRYRQNNIEVTREQPKFASSVEDIWKNADKQKIIGHVDMTQTLYQFIASAGKPFPNPVKDVRAFWGCFSAAKFSTKRVDAFGRYVSTRLILKGKDTGHLDVYFDRLEQYPVCIGTIVNLASFDTEIVRIIRQKIVDYSDVKIPINIVMVDALRSVERVAKAAMLTGTVSFEMSFDTSTIDIFIADDTVSGELTINCAIGAEVFLSAKNTVVFVIPRAGWLKMVPKQVDKMMRMSLDEIRTSILRLDSKPFFDAWVNKYGKKVF